MSALLELDVTSSAATTATKRATSPVSAQRRTLVLEETIADLAADPEADPVVTVVALIAIDVTPAIAVNLLVTDAVILATEATTKLSATDATTVVADVTIVVAAVTTATDVAEIVLIDVVAAAVAAETVVPIAELQGPAPDRLNAARAPDPKTEVIATVVVVVEAVTTATTIVPVVDLAADAETAETAVAAELAPMPRRTVTMAPLKTTTVVTIRASQLVTTAAVIAAWAVTRLLPTTSAPNHLPLTRTEGTPSSLLLPRPLRLWSRCRSQSLSSRRRCSKNELVSDDFVSGTQALLWSVRFSRRTTLFTSLHLPYCQQYSHSP